MTVALEKAGQQVVVKKAVAAFPAGCTAAQKQAVLSFLQQTLGTAPTAAEGECTMKKNELLPVFRALQSGKNRTSLAVVVGVLAMLLLLLSELLPAEHAESGGIHRPNSYRQPVPGPAGAAAGRTDQPAARGGAHRGHGRSFPPGRRLVYAVDARRGICSSRRRTFFYRMALRWLRQPICRRSAGSPCCVRAGEMSALQPISRSCCIRCWICPQTASVWSSASADPLLLSSTTIAYRNTKGGTVL